MRRRLVAFFRRYGYPLLMICIAIGIITTMQSLVGPWLRGVSQLPDHKDQLALQNDAFKTLIQLLAVAFFFITARFTWRVVKTAEQSVQINREGQMTDRFTKAIEQIGHEKLEVRLGGIYALERIANDAPEQDYRTIMEILTAFVRENARWKMGSVADNAKLLPPQTDIQAILTVIARRTRTDSGTGLSFNFAGTNLQKADFTRASLAKADFAEAHLAGASFIDTYLREARFTRADLAGSNLFGATLVAADLEGANLAAVNFTGAHLQIANMYGACLEGANFTGAHMQGAILLYANLKGADLAGADLAGANLSGADLRDAHLEGANLRGAKLTSANLEGAILEGADLGTTHLEGVNLS